MQNLRQGFRNGQARNPMVLQHGLSAPETVPGLQKEEKGDEGVGKKRTARDGRRRAGCDICKGVIQC